MNLIYKIYGEDVLKKLKSKSFYPKVVRLVMKIFNLQTHGESVVKYAILALMLLSNYSFATGWSNVWTELEEVWAVNDGSIMVKAVDMTNPETQCPDQTWLQVPVC